ncbi:hypothetical protein Sango_1367300 [Sesamum angolense]|uniref:Non-specific lipid-transfer protein n=1 Tax=Sesamum angolense TaxID=2727404 RepID=A0AAE1WSL9_9LAMI|nr:hypothetical protein Sango_1367300 [Sesamum angolense]
MVEDRGTDGLHSSSKSPQIQGIHTLNQATEISNWNFHFPDTKPLSALPTLHLTFNLGIRPLIYFWNEFEVRLLTINTAQTGRKKHTKGGINLVYELLEIMSVKVVYCLVCVMALLVSALAESHANEVSCPRAVALLTPCLAYLTGKASNVTVPCCRGANTLKDMVKTKPDIKSTCECLKKAAAAAHVITDRAKALPGLCHIQIPVPIDPNVDCSR